MRIKAFDIKNYRSIKEVSFKVLDPNITCFIGGNGSGKSNILQAIASLKPSTKFDETDFYVEASDDEKISISVSFTLEKSDEELLDPAGLRPSDLSGFRIVKEQAPGAEPKIYAELLDYDSKIEKRFSEQLAKLKRGFSSFEMTEEDIKASDKLVEPLLDYQTLKDTKQTNLEQLLAIVKKYDADLTKSGIDEVRLTEMAAFDPPAFANEKLFKELEIELLSLDNYTISNEALIEELTTRDLHPFLYDLLIISGKSADDFLKAEGNKRINISEHASDQLTSAMQKVWGSHGLPLIVQKDKKDTTLSFCSRTPHNKAIPLQSISLGTQWFLRFYTRLITATKQSKRIIWLLDEPDRGLHAKSQHDLIELIEEQSKEAQVLYCTHQPIMIQWHRLERINVVEDVPKNKEKKFGKGTKIHRRFWDDGEFDSPLKEVLKLFIGEDILWTKEHVVIEGPSDYFYLVGWANFFLHKNPSATIWNEEFSSPNRSFVPAGSIRNIPLFLYFLTKKNDLKTVNWASLTDTGNDHTDIKQVIGSTNRLERFSDRIIPLERPEGDKKVGKEFDIEDLFEREEFFNEAAEYYAAEYPDCKFPKFADISKAGKITKAIEAKVLTLNKDGDKKLSLDKPGIAQHIYIKLVIDDKKFSDIATKNFRATLKEINKAFNLEAKPEIDKAR